MQHFYPITKRLENVTSVYIVFTRCQGKGWFSITKRLGNVTSVYFVFTRCQGKGWFSITKRLGNVTSVYFVFTSFISKFLPAHIGSYLQGLLWSPKR